MSDSACPQLEGQIVWIRTGDVEFPYAAHADDQQLKIRLNDFPDEPLYTLLADDVELRHFDDWPATWQKRPPEDKPAGPPEDAAAELREDAAAGVASEDPAVPTG